MSYQFLNDNFHEYREAVFCLFFAKVQIWLSSVETIFDMLPI